MTLSMVELQKHIFELRDGLEEDLKTMTAEMEELDPASKDFADLDFEYNFINGQVVAFNYVLVMIGL